jgi:hypothetical protein
VLPEEVIQYIFNYLDSVDGIHLARAAVVCWRWRRASDPFILDRSSVAMSPGKKDDRCCHPKRHCPIRWKIAKEPACRRCNARQRLFRRALEEDDIKLIAWLWRLWPRLWLWLGCEDHGEMCKTGRQAIDLKMRAWSIAAEAGSLYCLRWLTLVRWKRYGQHDRILAAAIRGGHTNVLDFFRQVALLPRRCYALALANVNDPHNNA